ncbi:Tocopherol cyclase [Alkalibacterium subtropicum]|uniref:Tocopherol cyclase n=1 Tax=Alkalibacterium subtropicum TaxID=753702 RepID=A0A1I1LIF3_9LACT|nr:tocopherol cyclase family protein [Alkalibacterium subtropicum]SFC72726.1 Tocopherol cyclase [Alkalibacterium subtropicum]
MTNRFDFKGVNAQAPYFEGWYVKTTDAEQDFSLALIPGMALFSEKECFVQYNLYYKGKSVSGKITYPVEEFTIVSEPYSVLMPLFVLSEKGVKAHLKDEENDLLIDLNFGDFLPLRQSLFSPSIMGPLEYIRVPCSHDIVSMRHEVRGTVTVNGEKITLDKGTGYMEKDRGSTFPDRYIWAQSNSFIEDEESALSLAVADIDFNVFDLTGAIAVFHDGIKEHRFASYQGTLCKVTMDENLEGYTVYLKDYSKSLKVKVSLQHSHELIAPMSEGMDYPIKETMKAEIRVTFQEKNKQPVYLTSKNGAAEAVNWDN